MKNSSQSKRHLLAAGASLLAVLGANQAAHAGNLFSQQGNAISNSAPHIENSRDVLINRGALQQPTITMNLDGQTVVAIRTHLDVSQAGLVVWTGHISGSPQDIVVFAGKGNFFSGVVYNGADVYELRSKNRGTQLLNKLTLDGMPREDIGGVPDGGGSSTPPSSGTNTLNNVVDQDLLMVYTQQACDSAAPVNDVNCEQIRLNTIVAVNDLNASYQNSGVNIQLNLVGMALTNYDETGKSASQALTELRTIGDGQAEDVHIFRDSVGADLVAMIYDGPGCGIGYAPSNAATAFSVTKESCQVGNRTMAHEIGHNQGALHDRAQHSGGINGNYNYGYRRCADNGPEDLGAPYFRTIMSYSCSGAPRVGRFSNPNVSYAGVSQGIDPLLDPAKAAWNARTLNESATYVAGFRNTVFAPAPNPPTGLAGVSPDPYVVLLSWNDMSTNEQYFVLERSEDNVTFVPITQLGIDTESFVDFTVAPSTTYYYRIKAHNSGGDSAYAVSNPITTQALPSTVNDVASSETAGNGTVSGSYVSTQFDDGTVQKITEVSSGGPKPRRTESYSHQWNFNVTGGVGGVVATANAWVGGSEGAVFEYSSDGGINWNSMFVVTSNISSNVESFIMPGNTSGAIAVRVRDAAQTNGEGRDSVDVDHFVFTSNLLAGSPPIAPSAMTVAGTSTTSVDLSFTDNSSDEFGFDIYRNSAMPASCTDGVVVDSISANAGTGSVSATDSTAAPSSTYWYFVTAFNGAGTDGSCTNSAQATTLATPNMSASGNGYKVKGRHTVDVSWSGALGTNVDIVRDSIVVATTTNDGLYR